MLIRRCVNGTPDSKPQKDTTWVRIVNRVWIRCVDRGGLMGLLTGWMDRVG